VVAGHVIVDVAAAGVNFPDILQTRGLYQFKPPVPFSPGGEVAGTVVAVGSGVTSVAVGDRVAATMLHGAFAERVCVPEISCVKLPDAVSFEVGAATLLTYLTTYHALVDRAALEAGETLLVLGAAGGVGKGQVEQSGELGGRRGGVGPRRPAGKGFRGCARGDRRRSCHPLGLRNSSEPRGILEHRALVRPSHWLQARAAAVRTSTSLEVRRRWYARSRSPRSPSGMCCRYGSNASGKRALAPAW
jgi:hypothetical protein